MRGVGLEIGVGLPSAPTTNVTPVAGSELITLDATIVTGGKITLGTPEGLMKSVPVTALYSALSEL